MVLTLKLHTFSFKTELHDNFSVDKIGAVSHRCTHIHSVCLSVYCKLSPTAVWKKIQLRNSVHAYIYIYIYVEHDGVWSKYDVNKYACFMDFLRQNIFIRSLYICIALHTHLQSTDNFEPYGIRIFNERIYSSRKAVQKKISFISC